MQYLIEVKAKREFVHFWSRSIVRRMLLLHPLEIYFRRLYKVPLLFSLYSFSYIDSLLRSNRKQNLAMKFLYPMEAYVDTSDRLLFGSPSGFLVAVCRSPTATEPSLAALRPLFPSEGRTVDERT